MAAQNQHQEDNRRAADAAAPKGEAPSPESEVIELSESAAELVHKLTQERDEAVDGRLRALADFRNFQRRAGENEQRAQVGGVSRVVRSILPVLDHFDLALAQKIDQMSVQQLAAAVKIVRDELNKALAAQGVERIAPANGEPFDPHRHEAVIRQPLKGAAPNSVASTLQAGYALGEMVLRPAKVAVTPDQEAEHG